MALWISFSFLGWSIIALTLLFVVVYGVFTNTEPEVPNAETNTEAGFVRARALALLAALIPLLMYLLSLIAYHIFLVEDALLSLVHSAEVLEFALQRGLGCSSRKLPQTQVSCVLRAASWLLLVVLLGLFGALLVASAWGADAVGIVFAVEVIAVMTCIAVFHVFSLVWAPLLRYCAMESRWDAQGALRPPASWSHWRTVMRSRCAAVRSEMWYRAGLVCANALVGCVGCHCLCFASGDDMTEQGEHLQRDLLTWHGVGDCEDEDEHLMRSVQLDGQGTGAAYSASAPRPRTTARASQQQGEEGGERGDSADSCGDAPPQANSAHLHRQRSSLSGRRAPCCACFTHTHHGLWAPAAFGSARHPEAMCCGCMGQARGASELLISAIIITVFWGVLGPIFAYVADNNPSSGALAGAILASVYMWLVYAAVVLFLLFITADGDVCFAPGGTLGVCSSPRDGVGQRCRLSPQRTQQAWHSLLAYRVTVLSLLVGILTLSVGIPADGEDRPESASGGLIAAIVLLLLLPIFNAMFQGWQLGVRCCSIVCPSCCSRPCQSQACLVDSLGRMQDVRCRVCDPSFTQKRAEVASPQQGSDQGQQVAAMPAHEGDREDTQAIGPCYLLTTPCGHTCCCVQSMCLGCRSKWAWHSASFITLLTVLLLFSLVVYAQLPVMWVAIWLCTLIYCGLLINAIPTHGEPLAALEAVGLRQKSSYTLPPLGAAPQASPSPPPASRPAGQWRAAGDGDAAGPHTTSSALEQRSDEGALSGTSQSLQTIAKEDSLAPAAATTGAPPPPSSLLSPATKKHVSLLRRMLRFLSSSEESHAWEEEDASKPFVTQLVPSFVQVGDADDNTYHYRGHIAEDKVAYTAYAVEKSREVDAVRGALAGRHYANRDPLETIAYTERHLRMKLVVPCMVLALVTALVLILLVDAGIEKEGGGIRGWYDVSSPVAPRMEQTHPTLGFCEFDEAGLNIIDYGMLSKAIYLGANKKFYLAGVKQLIPGARFELQRLSDEVLNQPVFSVLTVIRPGGISPTHVLAQQGNLQAAAAFQNSSFHQGATAALQAAAAGNASAQDIQASVERLAKLANTGKSVPSINTTVVSIRGSLQGFDWSQDLYTWGTPLLMQSLQRVIPFLAPLRLTRADEVLLGQLSGIEEGVFSEFDENPRAFYVPITRVATALQRATRQHNPLSLQAALQSVDADPADIAAYNMSAPLGTSLVLTGHSLGGGVAMIAGASADVAAVSYSGPGPVLGHERYQRSIDAACPKCNADLSRDAVQRHAFNVVPDGDIVPWAGGQSTRAVGIECEDGLSACHSVLRSMCTIVQSCGDAWGRSIVSFTQSAAELEVTPPDEQTMSDCCINGQYGRGHSNCLKLLCSELRLRPALSTDLRQLC